MTQDELGHADDISWDDIRCVQAEITRWAESQFPHRTDFHALYKLVMEEVPELLTHKKEKGLGGIGLELADCFILLMDLASLWGVDVAEAIENKMRINYGRIWNKDPDTGIMQHVNQKMVPEIQWPEIDFTKAEGQRKNLKKPLEHISLCSPCPTCIKTSSVQYYPDPTLRPAVIIGTRNNAYCTGCRAWFEADDMPF